GGGGLGGADGVPGHGVGLPGLAGFQKPGARDSFGIASLSSSNRFPVSPSADQPVPVIFPPGRARLLTSPSSTGSPSAGTMMGIVFVASLAASIAPGTAKMTSTFSLTTSAARPGKRRRFHAADRYSMTTFCPTT